SRAFEPLQSAWRCDRIFAVHRSMNTNSSTIEVAGLDQANMAKLRRRARSLGISAETYARQLIEAGLLLEHRARSEAFDVLFAGVRKAFRKSGMQEQELDQLVDEARTRHHQRNSRKRR